MQEKRKRKPITKKAYNELMKQNKWLQDQVAILVDENKNKVASMGSELQKFIDRRVENKPETVVAKPIEGKKPDALDSPATKKWLIILSGVILILASLIGIVLWYESKNMILAALSVVALPGGVLLIWQGSKKSSEAAYDKNGRLIKSKGEINSINIYANQLEGGGLVPKEIKFEYVEDPKGYPRRLKNNGKMYYVHTVDPDSGELKPFVLPDRMNYYDPRELARVLELPAHQRFFTRRLTIWDKLKPLWIIAVMVVMWIIMITVGD